MALKQFLDMEMPYMLATPSDVAIESSVVGSTTYSYIIRASGTNGHGSFPSAPIEITTGPATLSAEDTITVTMPDTGDPLVSHYYAYRTEGGDAQGQFAGQFDPGEPLVDTGQAVNGTQHGEFFYTGPLEYSFGLNTSSPVLDVTGSIEFAIRFDGDWTGEVGASISADGENWFELDFYPTDNTLSYTVSVPCAAVRFNPYSLDDEDDTFLPRIVAVRHKGAA